MPTLNPEQIVTTIESAVEKSIQNQSGLPFLELIVILIAIALSSILGAYLAMKGKNLASKEDIGDLTNEVESVKNIFSRESMRDETRYKHFYSKKAETLETLFTTVANIQGMLQSTVNCNDSSEALALWKKTSETMFDLKRTADRTSIYLDDDEHTQIIHFADSIYNVLLHAGHSNMSPYTQDGINSLEEALRSTNEEIPKLVEGLRQAIKKSLTKFA